LHRDRIVEGIRCPDWLYSCSKVSVSAFQKASVPKYIRTVATVVAVIAITIAVAVTPPRKSTVRLRICGHPEVGGFERLTGVHFAATHCCSSGSMVYDLRTIEGAQAVYKMDHGNYATSLNQLSNELPALPKFQFDFNSDATNWWLSVPQQGLFAGNYLLTPGHLYFNKAAAASTNDPDLWSRK
jgi:hypothetical protein